MITKVPLNDLKRSSKHYTGDVKKTLRAIIKSGIFLRGEYIQKFEYAWAKYCGQKYCIAVKNGTDALTLSAMAMGLKKAFVQANTLPLTAQGLMLGGSQIDIIDVDENGRTTKKSKNLVPVLLYGRIPSVTELNSNLFDAAHAHGWKPPKHATATWSFYPTKTLGAFGDSGAITTNDSRLYEDLRLLSGVDDKLRHPDQINSRMDEIQAAILLIKLKYLDENIEERKKNALIYCENLPPNIVSVNTSENDLNHLYVIKVKERRNELKEFLSKQGIETKIHFPTALNELDAKWKTTKNLWGANQWCNHILTLPLFPGIKSQEILYVTKYIKKFFIS